MNDLALADNEGELSPEEAACLPAERRFLEHFIESGNGGDAARQAGLGNADSSAATLARIAYRYLNRPRVIAALTVMTRKSMRQMAPDALKAVRMIIRNPMNNQQLKAALSVINRVDPEINKQEISVTHEIISHEEEAVAQLRSLKALGVARDKLIEVYGAFGLERYEKLLAMADEKNNAPKVIDADFEEVEPASDFNADEEF
jgi:phage terminase small subunit